MSVSEQVNATITSLETLIAVLPEPSQQDAARNFLSVGQEGGGGVSPIFFQS
jgi:hypothetical protein